jgi:hypothetical protein
MQLKPITAIIVLIVVASLSLAGCTFPISTSSPTPTPTPTPTPSSLKAFVTAFHDRHEQIKNANRGQVFEQWEATWINDTTVNVRFRAGSNGSTMYQFNETFQRFATIADASDFAKSKCDGWRQTSSKYLDLYDESFIFNRSTGRDPSVFFYCNNTVNANNNSVGYSFFQLDDIVIYSVVTPAVSRPSFDTP